MSIPLIYQDEVAETIIVTRAQRIHHQYEDSISYFCHLSKNLWNQAHHSIYVNNTKMTLYKTEII